MRISLERRWMTVEGREHSKKPAATSPKLRRFVMLAELTALCSAKTATEAGNGAERSGAPSRRLASSAQYPRRVNMTR